MGKRKDLVRTYSNVAVLDGVSKTQFIGQVLVRRAKEKFSYLGDSRLDEAIEDWQTMDALRAMYDEYNGSMNPQDANIAYELGKFIYKHN
jgi:hypothetical protein